MFIIHSISNTNGNNYVEVIGDQRKNFSAGGYLQIRGSKNNDGIYKLSAVTFVNGYTRLTPEVAIPSTSTDGYVNGGIYQVDFSDATLAGKQPVIIAPSTYNTTATSLTLPSRGSFDYGERLVENTVHLLENFAGKTAPVNPTIGQQWYDFNTLTMKSFDGVKWSSDINVNDGRFTLTDPQNNNSKLVFTAAEPDGMTATGVTLYPEADVAKSQPIFRVLNAVGDVHLAVLRGDGIATDTRFIANSDKTSELKGKLAVGNPSVDFSDGSKAIVNGHLDVVGKVILDESAQAHGIEYRASGSSLKAVDNLWTTTSTHSDSMSFYNSSQQVAVIGAVTKFFTPVEMSETLKVAKMATFTDITSTGTIDANVIKAKEFETASLLVPLALSAGKDGSKLLGQLDVNGMVVSGLITPTGDKDAVNKKYVDDLNFLSKLRDVDVSTVADTQSLVYDGVMKKWMNKTLGPDNINGIDGRIKDKAAESVLAATHVGVTPTYDNVAKALKFALNQQTLNASGDATGTATFDWSGNVSLPLTLKSSGVTAGQWTKVTVNAKGIVTSGALLTPDDIPTLDPSKIVGSYNLQNKYKVYNAIDPTDAGDYVTLRFLQNYKFDAGTF